MPPRSRTLEPATFHGPVSSLHHRPAHTGCRAPRAGLFAQSNAAAEASPFGFAAVALLVGLFSEQAIEKLRQLAGDPFTSVPACDDHFERVEKQPDKGDNA
jgi:hypothetical protein